MRHPVVFLGILLITKFGYSQENGNVSGGYESLSQWYQPDEKTGATFYPGEARFRSNNYFRVDYRYSNFSAGLQYEAYLATPILGYAPELEGNDLATYYVNFSNDNLDITAGYFYDQFGSGLIFRSWEDRQLGINNAIKGIRISYNATEDLTLTGLTGKQRIGFETSGGTLSALNAEFNLGSFLNIESVGLHLGGSYVGRYIDNSAINETYPTVVGAYSGRLGLNYNNFDFGLEVISKGEDLRYETFNDDGIDHFDKGSAILATAGYSEKGLGITAQYRRLENMAFYSDREAEGNAFNNQLINYVPGLTKQHDYSLANIYVYNAQGRMLYENNHFGENGGQIDMYFNLPKGSLFGSEHGTKVALNFSTWYGLGVERNLEAQSYKVTKEFGEKFFHDANIEI